MMKLKLIYILFAALILTGCNNKTDVQEVESNPANSIIVRYGFRQTEIPTLNDTIPVLKVLSACNVDIEWTDDDNAVFELNGKKYLISISSISITEENSTYNCITIPPGTVNAHLSAAEKEIYVDIATMKGILFELNITAYIRRGTD